jgi:ribonuclease T2
VKLLAAMLAAALGLLPLSAIADGTPGEFDFYVLALSWSPSYCRSVGPSTDQAQCGPAAKSDFIVHGLWPQKEQGYPETCATKEPLRVPYSLAATLSDLMPARLVFTEWRRHGTCTGLTQSDYLALVRAARAKVTVPQSLVDPAQETQVPAHEIEDAFTAANPGLSSRGIAVSCKDDRLAEVRICLTKSLEFRRCAEVDERGCNAPRLRVPVG